MALASYRSILGGVRTISISAFSDFSVGTHAAKMLATHAAIMGPLVGIVGQGGIVKSVSSIRIQAQMKLIEPTELIAGLAHGVIAQNGAGVPFGYIRRMGTCPGPSIITCTCRSQALCVKAPKTSNSPNCARSLASYREPGRSPSPSDTPTS